MIIYFFLVLSPIVFIFTQKLRFFAVILSFCYLVFFLHDTYLLISSNDSWGLFQTELKVSKNVYYIKIICFLFDFILLFLAYKFKNLRIAIFIFFTICNLLSPFNLLERFFFGR